MKKIITSLFSVVFLIWMSNAKADVQFGVGLMMGQVNADGTETEGTAADTSDRSESFDEFFVGADVFVENVFGNGLTVGLSYVPLDIEIGDGQRTDSAAGSDVASEADTGTRTASADLSDLFTLYTNIPMGDGGMYGLLGAHFTTVKTSESLPNSSYGNEDIYGAQIGLGFKDGNGKIELFYSDFEDISLTSSGGNSNSISADADALTLRFSYGF